MREPRVCVFLAMGLVNRAPANDACKAHRLSRRLRVRATAIPMVHKDRAIAISVPAIRAPRMLDVWEPAMGAIQLRGVHGDVI